MSSDLGSLDVNMGQKILVRLRPPFSPDTFLTEEDVVQTMLHEVRTPATYRTSDF